MSARLTLLKGPVFQKLLVLVLVTFGGLGYPPPLSEAVKCYKCAEDIKGGKEMCKGEEMDCDVGCAVLRSAYKGNGKVRKDCHDGTKGDPLLTEAEFKCMQEKLGQKDTGGNCLKANQVDYDKVSSDCFGASRSEEGNGEARQKLEGNDKEYCHCNTELCNNEDLRYTAGGPGGSNGGDGTKGRASSVVVATPRKIVLMGAITGMIIHLRTNCHFYWS